MSDRVYTVLRLVLFSALVVWGGLTVLQYLSIPVHQAVLLSDAGRQTVAAACPGGGTLCTGWNAFFPFIGQFFTWARPFLAFAIWSVLVFLALLVKTFLRDGEWKIRLEVRPVWLIAAFVGLAWLHFTVIGAGSTGGEPFSRLYEPLPQVYNQADEEQLQVLKENFDTLNAHGCLSQVGTTQNGAGIFRMSALCMQASFFSRVVPQMLVIAVLLLELMTLGRFFLRRLKLHAGTMLTEAVFSAGLGACVMIALLWFIVVFAGWINQPVYNMAVGWGLMVLIPALLWRDAWYWVRQLWGRQWTYDASWHAGLLPLAWILLSLLALNFLNVVRPFPIGWDDLGRYINMPRLLVSYGLFIPQLATYQWEYLSSLGFLLFGYDNVFSATAAMQINWMAGLLAVASVYAFGRLFLGPRCGVLAALLYYILPLVGHFSFADMKVDNAVFFTGALAVLALFLAIFPQQEGEDGEEREDQSDAPIDWRWLVVCGVLAGVAFSLKPTVIMTFFAIGTMLYGARVHWTAFVGTMALTWVLYLLEGRLNLQDIAGRVYGDPDALNKTVILIALTVLGVGLAGYSAFLRPRAFKKTTIAAGIIIGSFFLVNAPWLLSNNIANGNVIPRLVLSTPNTLTPTFSISTSDYPKDFGQPIHTLPPELQVDLAKCGGTSKSEELDRYWGYGSGWGHYLTLPWRTVMNADSAGYYVTTYAALLLFPLLLLMPFFWRRREGKWMRWLFFGTLFMLMQWVIFANGIPWYGIGTFLGLVIGLEVLVMRSPDIPSKVLAGILITLSIMTGFSNRFWQFDQQKNLLEYAIGKISGDAMRERTIPYYDDIRDAIGVRARQTPERPYAYRMGTFIPYFIPRNLEVLPVADQQLDFFHCIYQEHDAALTLRRLQALGFNSMIFDTNTATIERDPNGSLHKKVQEFVDFVNTPGLGLGIAVNDTDAGIAFILLPEPVAGSGTTLP